MGISHANITKNGRACVLNPLDPEEFRRQAYTVVDFVADYYHNIANFPIQSQVKPNYLRDLLPETAPYDPEPLETILSDVNKCIIPGITHWQSPSHFAYFPSSGSTAGFLGEMLCTAFNVPGFNWISSPAATELESIVMDWLGKMLNLPRSYLFSGNGGGVIHGTTCEAILCTLVASRDQVLDKIGRENIGKLIVYGSDQTHSTLKKAARIAGIHPSNFREVQTSRSTSFALSPHALQAAISSDVEAGLIPLFLCATVGTTSSTAIDPVASLCQVAQKYGMWVHVDAAYAGNACICSEFQHYIDGVDAADSFSLNAHKWFFTNLDCCCLWVKNPSALIKALSTNPEFLRNKATSSKQVVDYKDWQVALTRRFRAMKLWLVLRSYGVANLQSFIRAHVKMAQQFEAFVAMDKRFEIVTPRTFSMVCFRLVPSAVSSVKLDYSLANGLDLSSQLPKETSDEDEKVEVLNMKLLEAVNASGRLYMTHTVVGGEYVLRFAVGATLTEEKHVIQAWEVIQDHADTLVGTIGGEVPC